jgi:hypothetical protein
MIYVINRLGGDNILVLDGKDLRKAVRQFSTGKGSNPQDIAFVSPTRAYVARYDRASLLIVNPATGDSLKAVDLSAFADADGVPEMAQVFVVGSRVYVTCQRLDRKARFAPTDKSVVAVIDARADTVMDLDPGTAGVQGIDLTLKNPISAALQNGKIYLSCVGAYSILTDGGIEVVDTAQNRSLGVSLSETAMGGDSGPMAMASDSTGYVVVSDASFVNSIRPFNLSTKTVSGSLQGHSGGFTPDIQVAERRLYVADQGTFTNPRAAGLLVYTIATGAKQKGPISTGLPPSGIAFVSPLTADFDGNGIVDLDDFFAFAAVFGKKQGDAGFDAKYDLSGNSSVGFEDFFEFADQFAQRR